MPDLDGLALLRALVTQQRLALAGGGTGTVHTAVSPALPLHGRRHKPSPAPGRGGRGSSYSSDDPEQERIAALVTLAQQGDGEAFGQIYDRYVDAVYRYLYYRVGSAPLAEDLTSETFVRALRRIDSFHWQGKDIGAWFVTIARNLVPTTSSPAGSSSR